MGTTRSPKRTGHDAWDWICGWGMLAGAAFFRLLGRRSIARRLAMRASDRPKKICGVAFTK